MRVARLHGRGDVRLAEEPAAEAGPGETLVRVTAVGLCGSDLHWYDEGGIGDAVLGQPLVLGHEMGGVALSGPLTGQRVAIDPAIPDGTCEQCLAGHPNLCPAVRFAGHGGLDGGLREQLAWPTDRLHVVPDGVSDAGVAVLEPLGVALHATDLGHVRLAATVTVVGCGPIGLLLVRLARLAGATTVQAVEPLDHRQVAALAMGADVGVAPGDTADLEPAAVVFEVDGSAPAVTAAVLAARPGGRVVLAGIPADDRTGFPAATARRKGLSFAVVRRMGEVYPRAIDLAARGLVDVDAVVSHRFALADAGAAFAVASARTGLKVIVEP